MLFRRYVVGIKSGAALWEKLRVTYSAQVVSAGGYAGDGTGVNLTLNGRCERVRVCESRELEKPAQLF